MAGRAGRRRDGRRHRPERAHGSKGFLVRCVTNQESRVNVS
ncbi:hypothetical protein SNL152K_8558 [Streptomyces sp. NL15-2K]|nr:hypothetical protein SNL152K_8558 [Streptomyces sp. NL15-2K]